MKKLESLKSQLRALHQKLNNLDEYIDQNLTPYGRKDIFLFKEYDKILNRVKLIESEIKELNINF